MKSVYICLVLFSILVGLVFANTVYLRKFFDKTDFLLDGLPDNLQTLENMSFAEKTTYTSILTKVIDDWSEKERYMSVVLDHRVAGQMPDKLAPALEFFKAKEYESFLASMSEAKLILRRMKQSESLSLDTIF